MAISFVKQKKCTSCGVSKPIQDFYVRHSGPQAGKPYPSCKECDKHRVKAYRDADPEGNNRARVRAWSAAQKAAKHPPG